MALTLLHNISRKKAPFNRSLTVAYWKNRANRFFPGLLEDMVGKGSEELVFRLEDLSTALMSVYKEANTISAEEAKEAYPDIQEMRDVITAQNSRFAEIDYMQNNEVKQKFKKLVRLINHLEARVYTHSCQNVPPRPAPDYIKQKMRDNSRKMVKHGL